MPLIVIVLAASIVVAADRHVPAAEVERGIVPRGEWPTPGSVPLPPKPPPGLGIDVGKIPWTESNIATLRAANMADVRRFLSGLPMDNRQRIMPSENVDEFSWVDLAGTGKYALVMVQMPAVCHVCNSVLLVCQQSEVGRIHTQVLPGTYPLTRAIRDLNGDGKKELIIPRPALHPDSESFGAVAEIDWPRVYRLENGKYAEASSEFPNYYYAEVLPPIENAISQARYRVANGPIGAQANPTWLRYMHHKVAGLTMERDKILRMIGRDPDAGLQQAREWMNSPDAALVQGAITVLRDMRGHASDLRAATDRLKEEGCDFNAFGSSALRGDKAEGDWLVYANAKNGLSFRYPPSMRVEEKDPASFGFDSPPEAVVDVLGPGAVLRFI